MNEPRPGTHPPSGQGGGAGEEGACLLKDEILVFSAGDPCEEKEGGMLGFMKHSHVITDLSQSSRVSWFRGGRK